MVTSGDIVQSTTYYPYGEPTIEPRGQRFLFGGKEREHAAGRNSYDFGARNLAANADRFAEKFYHISIYSYCAAAERAVLFVGFVGDDR